MLPGRCAEILKADAAGLPLKPVAGAPAGWYRGPGGCAPSSRGAGPGEFVHVGGDAVDDLETAAVLPDRRAEGRRRLAVLLVAMLHFISDDDDPPAIVADIRDALRSGRLITD
jgi:hypothetical protein